jgi:Uma2 family endonuclease
MEEMAGPAERRYTIEEYLEMERSAEGKSEFIDGQIYAMAGVSRRHDRITLNIGGELRLRLRNSPCTPHSPDMRVRVSPRAYFYPDVSVGCREDYEDSFIDTLKNPVVVFEVLSPSTERYDRGTKFKLYQGVESISDIVLISQDDVSVEHYRRGDALHWDYRLYASIADELHLPSISCSLPLSEVYDGLQFPAEVLLDSD